MPHPGVQSQFVGKSGGNQFSGEYYLDWYNNSLQGSNIPESYTVPTAFNNQPFVEHSNEIDRYYDTAINLGGAIKKDKVWWYATYREQFIAVAQLNFRFGKTFDTKLWNAVGKGTYQATKNHKFIGYYQWGQKVQPIRLSFNGYTYLSEGPTNRQDSGSWAYKAEWNGTLSDKLYVEARYADFGYYFPLITNGSEPYFWRDSGTLEILGSHTKTQNDRDLKQWTGGATYFLDTERQSYVQGWRRASQGAAVGRVPAGRRRRHRAHLQQRPIQSGHLPHSDGHASGRAGGQAQSYVAQCNRFGGSLPE